MIYPQIYEYGLIKQLLHWKNLEFFANCFNYENFNRPNTNESKDTFEFKMNKSKDIFQFFTQ